MKYGTTRGTRGRRAYRPKGRLQTWAQPRRYPLITRFDTPDPNMPPEVAARVRALAGLGLSDAELRRVALRYVEEHREAALA